MGKLTICLLSRIVSNDDPINNENNGPIESNVAASNNIVTHNTGLVNLPGKRVGPTQGGRIFTFVKNPVNDGRELDLHFSNSFFSSDYFNEAGIIVTLSPLLWDSWITGGQGGDGISVWNDDEHQISIQSNDAVLTNLNLPEDSLLQIAFNFYLLDSILETKWDDFFLYLTTNEEGLQVGSIIDFEVTRNGENPYERRGIPAITQNSVDVFPNPARGFTNLSLNLVQPAHVEVFVLNALGKAMNTAYISGNFDKGTTLQKINTTDYAAGVYYLKIVIGNEVQYSKLIISGSR